jgi:Fe-S cluster assembly scaffold protein SufB
MMEKVLQYASLPLKTYAALLTRLTEHSVYTYRLDTSDTPYRIRCLPGFQQREYVVPQGAQVSVVIEVESMDHFSCQGLHFRLEEGARVECRLLDRHESSPTQDKALSTEGFNYSFMSVSQAAQSEFTWTGANTVAGAHVMQWIVDAHLHGEAARFTAKGIYRVSQKGYWGFQCHVTHHASETSSLLQYRGILKETARGSFIARTLILPNLENVSAHQKNQNLLRSPSAIIQMQPELEIYSERVTCSHGATVGALDPEALFYLRSRGLPESLAAEILEEAFLAELLA